ncbi:FAD-binding protein [Acetobacteraceae bacterium ESL0697]|nr:FAD-binding protein [Acetobacteraceae bacterium ESL0697]
MTAPFSILENYRDWPVIIGGGLAAYSTALHLGRPCLVITPDAQAETTSSHLAQGGMCAAIGPGDSPACHAEDTIRAGAGLCDTEVVKAFTEAGPSAVETLLAWGVPLACDEKGALALHLEAAHQHPRIVFAGGDRTGASIMKSVLKQAAMQERIHLLAPHHLISLDVEDNALRGLWTSAGYIPTNRCVLAAGSTGGLYRHTTIPLNNKGHVLGMALRAGIEAIDLEFTQFHPTALRSPLVTGRLPLVSEAVRGAGAVLVTQDGQRFTDELGPRDVVGRTIAAQIAQGHEVFLDATKLPAGHFSTIFPGITQSCLLIGIDPDRQLIPVQPAMHYHMGGLKVDLRGRTSVKGIWACGELACTGLHGANRLASNSLLEALVGGQWVARDLDNRALSCAPPAQKDLPLAAPGLSSEWSETALMEQSLGIIRDEEGIKAFLDKILPRAHHDDCALAASLMGWAALQRQESRGGHWRRDYPETLPMARRQSLTLHDLPL